MIVQTNFQYKEPLISLNLQKLFFIILHHIEAEQATPEEIDTWHKENGWNGFGYNEYIRKDGTVYVGRGDNIGAQCAGMNSKSYGIAVEGNYNTEFEMPDVQFKSLLERVEYNKSRFPNSVEITPHSRFVDTKCPGQYFPFQKLIAALAQDEIFDNDLKVLKACGVINSPDYWEKNAVFSGSVSGEYARALIHNMASKLPK